MASIGGKMVLLLSNLRPRRVSKPSGHSTPQLIGWPLIVLNFTLLSALTGSKKLLHALAGRAIKLCTALTSLSRGCYTASGATVASIEGKCDYQGSTPNLEESRALRIFTPQLTGFPMVISHYSYQTDVIRVSKGGVKSFTSKHP